MQRYEPDPDLYSLQTGMEMLGMASKNGTTSMHEQDHLQANYYPQSGNQFNNLMVVDDSSLRCLLPSQNRLSLSLCNSDHHQHEQFGQFRDVHDESQDGRFHIQQHQHNQGSIYQQQQQMMVLPQQMRNCKYLLPSQELLKEFCNILPSSLDQKKKSLQTSINHREGGQQQSSSSSSAAAGQSLQSLDILELQRRKARLYAMLEEVDMRYRKYCDQMRAVVYSFEAVAGEGSARVYTTLAAKAMSRHFRCLRDGIVNQIKATKKAMGEKDPVAHGSSRGETPRLKLLDQCMRQQKAFQQGCIMESHPWRPQRGLPERAVTILRAWLFEHFLNPYPTDVDKHILARQTGLSRSQVSNWFINARVRLWKPMVEEMYMEEMKEQEQVNSTSQQTTATTSSAATVVGLHQDMSSSSNNLLVEQVSPNPKPNPNHDNAQVDDHQEDQKPDHDSLASIINNSAFQYQLIPRPSSDHNFGVQDMDFPSYAINNNSGSHYHHNGGGAVSLTLGLKQHNVGSGRDDSQGITIASFASSDQQQQQQQEQMDSCQPVQFSMYMEGDGQNLIPYRNLMGAQLLRDLAG